MRRYFWRLFIPFVVLLGAGWVGLHAYLSSDHALSHVAQKIAVALNTRVGISGLEIGINGCAVSKLQVFEVEPAPADPFLTVERVETDLTLSDIVQGNAEPKQITLIRPHIEIRHDAAGHLLTQFPKPRPSDKPMPQIRVQDATVTIHKIGEPDAVFLKIDATITAADGKLQLNGTANDPNWGGSWTVAGLLPKDGGPSALHLKNKGVHVTQAMLERVPYVPAKVWRHVRLEGDTPVDLRLIIGAPQEKVLYRIELAPINTSVYVSSIDLSAAMARGGVLIENDRVLLRDVRGQVAEGELALPAADLDFRPVNTIMHFDMVARDLRIQGLPASWKLPPRLGGKLSGKANIAVQVVNGVALPSGTGEGDVQNAMLGPIPMPNYGLKIQADRSGFRFEPKIGNSLIPILRSVTAP